MIRGAGGSSKVHPVAGMIQGFDTLCFSFCLMSSLKMDVNLKLATPIEIPTMPPFPELPDWWMLMLAFWCGAVLMAGLVIWLVHCTYRRNVRWRLSLNSLTGSRRDSLFKRGGSTSRSGLPTEGKV